MVADRTAAAHEIEQLIHELTWRDRRQFARQVSRHKLSGLQYLALHEIGQLAPDATMGAIGEVIQVPASSMTNLVDRLVEAGLAARGVTPADRRAVAVNLTPASAELIENIEEAREERLHAALKDQPDHDLADLARILAAMLKGMNEN